MSVELAWEESCDPAALAALESEWWDLWRRVDEATPFQSPAWLLPWWHAFAPGDLFVLAARSAGRLVGLAPFYLEHGGRDRVLPVGISVSDYQDILADDEHAAAVRRGFVVRIMHCASPWTSWEFVELPPNAQARQMDVPHGCLDSVEPASACPVLVLPQDVGALFHIFSRRKRRALRLARNRAAGRGQVEIVCAQDPACASATLETLIRLHAARWQERGGTGVLADRHVCGFHRQVVPRMSCAGLLRLCELRIAGAVAAVYYGFHHRDRAYGYLTGFDPIWQYESPGVILLAHVIEQAVREGAREFHFLRGREPYKYGWGAEDRWNMKRVFRRAEAHALVS